jgi:hypothetical protein
MLDDIDNTIDDRTKQIRHTRPLSFPNGPTTEQPG